MHPKLKHWYNFENGYFEGGFFYTRNIVTNTFITCGFAELTRSIYNGNTGFYLNSDYGYPLNNVFLYFNTDNSFILCTTNTLDLTTGNLIAYFMDMYGIGYVITFDLTTSTFRFTFEGYSYGFMTHSFSIDPSLRTSVNTYAFVWNPIIINYNNSPRYDNSSMKLYINGNQISSTVIRNDMGFYSSDLFRYTTTSMWGRFVLRRSVYDDKLYIGLNNINEETIKRIILSQNPLVL